MTFWVELPRDFVSVSGPDAVSFLQGQLSQDVEGLAVGSSAWSFVLQPQGKVDAWLRVTRSADDAFVLDVDRGWGEAVVARLERFMLRTKATFEALPDWHCIAVRGDGPDDLDLRGPDVSPPEGVPEGTAEDYEVWRITHGVPAMGRELTEKTIPAESGVVDRSVSFTKGCYTGQELVARIDSRGGNVPRRLRLVALGDGAPTPEPGTPVVVEGAEVGVITSAARSVALAYVKRDVDPPAEATVAGAAARIEALP
ncbi:MAG: tRNA-modifying protein YgfZ [Actinomycetota bacterium]|nr:tRNA-modifying protein YgfZ [Actinomycetota bacterium]